MDYNRKRSAIELPIVISCRWRILISTNIKTGSIGRDISNYSSGDYDGKGFSNDLGGIAGYAYNVNYISNCWVSKSGHTGAFLATLPKNNLIAMRQALLQMKLQAPKFIQETLPVIVRRVPHNLPTVVGTAKGNNR